MIDLLYQHRVDPNVPVEEVAGTVKDLIVQRQRWFTVVDADDELIERVRRFASALAGIPRVSARIDGVQ